MQNLSVDFRLVFAEIPDNVVVVGKRMAGMGKKPFFIHPQAFLFQTEISLQKQLTDFGMICMEHGQSLPFVLSQPEPSA